MPMCGKIRETKKEKRILKTNFTFFHTFMIFFALQVHYHNEVFKACLESFRS